MIFRISALTISILGVVACHNQTNDTVKQTTDLLVQAQPQIVEAVGLSSDVEVMILGSAHFAQIPIEVDNILSPKRQAELEALVTSLATFNPTVIAVEQTAPPPYNDTRWPDFDAEMLATDRNETVQIGYRLAERANVDRVYAIDEQPEGDEPEYYAVAGLESYAEDLGRLDEVNALADWGPFMAKMQSAIQNDTVSGILIPHNDESFIDDFYWNALLIGEGERQPGADLAAYWFMRNAKIFNKLTQVTEPGDRVVIIIGAAHVHWLSDMVDRVPGYREVAVIPFLEAADK